jgi:DNA-binding GntR family transcriptional regulator
LNVEVRTLSERVYKDLRDRIVAGRLGTAVPIRQDALAAELGVSKIPVREALARLEQVGLLVGRTNRGYFVPAMSASDIDDIYSLRLAVEPRAAAFAAGTADDAARQAAQAAFSRLEGAPPADVAELAACTHDFHAALVRPGKRPLTTQLVERLLVLSARYLAMYWRRSNRVARSRIEYRSILGAWLTRDSESVQLRLAAHIDQMRQDLKSGFERAS